MSDREPMTKEGELALQSELQSLLKERPRISKAIAEAREFGDLKENAEYHAAKEQQGISEARIREIESKLSRSQVINIKEIPETGKVIFGATINLYEIDTNQEVNYKIVGEDEADVKKGKISFSSPISRAMIGKEAGEIIKFDSPSGIKEYEIVSIRHIYIICLEILHILKEKDSMPWQKKRDSDQELLTNLSRFKKILN